MVIFYILFALILLMHWFLSSLCSDFSGFSSVCSVFSEVLAWYLISVPFIHIKLWTNQAWARQALEAEFQNAIDDAVEEALAEKEAEDAETGEDINEEKDILLVLI